MDSNSRFERNKLYISNNLCIFRADVINNVSARLTDIKTNRQKRYNNNEIETIKMFLSNENTISPTDYLSNQFITDLFLLSFSYD